MTRRLTTKQRQPAKGPTLTYKTCWRAPGYRDLRLVLVDPAGTEYELQLPPADVQKLIFECADAAKQIGNHPPIDWESHPTQIYWPTVTPWKAGPAAATTQQGKGGPTVDDPERPYCKPDQSCCDFTCGN